ncbi:MAG: FAD-dependent oxidoreductase [Acidobacteria bacterium]|nr:FAD-dependent oxidoreductase [Acidobacteriota bacterium]
MDAGLRIAIAGSGISGLAAGWLLSRRHTVTLYEADSRLGGHTHTHDVATPEGTARVDTGFIVHNEVNYPLLVRLLRELGLATRPSDMSFGVSGGNAPTWSSRGVAGLFADPRNAISPAFYRFLLDITRFNRRAPRLLDEPGAERLTLGGLLRREGFSEAFENGYLRPMASAVWSTPSRELADFPAATLVEFFRNHGYLGVTTQHPWRVLEGGSSAYIPHLAAAFGDRIRLGTGVKRVERDAEGVTVHAGDRAPERYDAIVLAVHGDHVLRMLAAPTPHEESVFSEFRSSVNPTWLHTDTSFLPKSRAAWASWNYHVAPGPHATGTRVTYHMNRLQSLQTRRDLCVTLHPEGLVDESLALRKLSYEHPLFTRESVDSQKRWNAVSGRNRTHYAGAYWGYGFHEDGLASAVRVAGALGVSWP